MIGKWVKEEQVGGDFNFLVPEGYYVQRYTEDVPINDDRQFECIANYILNQYSINENEALIHWAYYKDNKQNKRGVIGESFSLRGELNGNFAILRLEESYLDENKPHIYSKKFLYLFFTALSVPIEFPPRKYNEIKKTLIDIVNEYELKINIDRMGIFAPTFYLINDQVDCEFLKRFDLKINEISKQILFHNPIKDLHKSKMINIYRS